MLFEAAPRVGGVIRSERVDGYLHEWAANGFLDNVSDGGVWLAEQLGVPVEAASPAARRRWIFVDGALKAVPQNPLEALRTDLISARGKLFALGEPLRRRVVAGDESVGAFAKRRLGPEIARVAVGPMVTGVFAGDADQLSLRAAFPKIAELEARGGLVRGLVSKAMSRMRESRANGQPRGPMKLCAPIGGIGALVHALASELSDAIHTGAVVERVERLKNGRLRLRGQHLGKVAARPFDAVVLAVNAPVAARLLAPAVREAVEPLSGIEYARVAVTYLGYPRGDVPHPLGGFGFIVAEGEPLRVLGCVFESEIFSGRAPDGHVLFRCVMGGVRDDAICDLDDTEVIEAARTDLDRALGIQAAPAHAVVHRHERAIAQYTIGHCERVRAAEEVCEPAGVVLAGAAYHGVAVNSCIGDAARVKAKVLARIAALALAACAVAGPACSGGGSPPPRKSTGGATGDAGDAGQGGAAAPAEGTAGSYRLAPVDDWGANAGTIEVDVVWPRPAAELLRAPGRNACGLVRRAPIPVAADGVIADRYATERMIALSGAVVTIADIAAGKPAPESEPAELAVRGCTLEPRVVRVARLGAPLALINDDEQRHTIELARATDGAAAEPLATIPLAVIGRRVEVPLERPGIVRVATAADPDDVGYAVVPAHPYVVVTDASGTAVLSDVPPGTYRIEVWYPPVTAGGKPHVGAAEITVANKQTARARVALGP